MTGLCLSAIGLGLFTLLGVHSTYVGLVLPAIIIVSVGMGLSFVGMSSTSLLGVKQEDAGVASALVNATQQMGGSLGAALINTIATGSDRLVPGDPRHVGRAEKAGSIHGYTTAFTFSAIMLAPRRGDRLHPHQGAQGNARSTSRRWRSRSASRAPERRTADGGRRHGHRFDPASWRGASA